MCLRILVPISLTRTNRNQRLLNSCGAWKKNNFGRMGALTVYFDNRPVNRRAGEIRARMNGVTLINAAIICIRDKAPAVTEITADLTICVESGKRSNRFYLS